MSDALSLFDAWFDPSGASALVIREPLVSVEGPDGVLFPATFAASEDRSFRGGYNVDTLPDGSKVCLIDSVGSQANRMEPLFSRPPFDSLVPQVIIEAGAVHINLLEAGHRAGDAAVRCSALRDELQAAFRALQAGNAEPLARVAPTSLVFGVWDSRDTQAKVPRLIASTIRAYGVVQLTRSAQFVPATDFVAQQLLPEPADKKAADAYAERGFVHVPASASPGGVLAQGGIRRDATLHLAALRHLRAGTNDYRTLALRRYVLGLALVAFTHPSVGYLRQGCNLVLSPEAPRDFVEVHPDGRRVPSGVGPAEALVYATAAATAFGVGPSRTVPFDRERAAAEVTDGAGTKKRAGKAAAPKASK